MKFKDKIYSKKYDYYEDFYTHIYFTNAGKLCYIDDTDASNYLVYVTKRPTWF